MYNPTYQVFKDFIGFLRIGREARESDGSGRADRPKGGRGWSESHHGATQRDGGREAHGGSPKKTAQISTQNIRQKVLFLAFALGLGCSRLFDYAHNIYTFIVFSFGG